MKLLSIIYLSIGAILLFVLMVLRFAFPEFVVNQMMGFFLNFGWASLMFLAIAEWKGLAIGHASAGKPITMISALIVAIAMDFILGLGVVSKSESNPIILVFLAFVIAIIILAWWKILWRNETE